MSNTVEYCRIVGIFGTFLVIFTCFLHYSTLTNKKTNNYSFWIDFSDTNQIIYSFWFVSIRHYSTYYGKSSLIIRFDSFRFDSFYDSNHLFFDSFRFVLGYRLYRFDSVTNRITKSTIRPSLACYLSRWRMNQNTPGQLTDCWMSDFSSPWKKIDKGI